VLRVVRIWLIVVRCSGGGGCGCSKRKRMMRMWVGGRRRQRFVHVLQPFGQVPGCGGGGCGGHGR